MTRRKRDTATATATATAAACQLRIMLATTSYCPQANPTRLFTNKLFILPCSSQPDTHTHARTHRNTVEIVIAIV